MPEASGVDERGTFVRKAGGGYALEVDRAWGWIWGGAGLGRRAHHVSGFVFQQQLF